MEETIDVGHHLRQIQIMKRATVTGIRKRNTKERKVIQEMSVEFCSW